MPLFAVALADPHTAFTREETSYPGRRIALLVDGSTSMVMKFESKTLKTPENRAFYTAVAAAEHFMKLRMNGRYHDLIALIQFGNEAYVVTPFTTDYDNILLSIRLISSPKEWGSFNDWGTTIIQGLNQATRSSRRSTSSTPPATPCCCSPTAATRKRTSRASRSNRSSRTCGNTRFRCS